jgi:hypothetical protein
MCTGDPGAIAKRCCLGHCRSVMQRETDDHLFKATDLSPVFNGGRPFITDLDQADGFFPKTPRLRPVDCPDITHIALHIHLELNDDIALDFIFFCLARILEVFGQKTLPGGLTSGEFGLDLHLGKGFIGILGRGLGILGPALGDRQQKNRGKKEFHT